MKILFYLCLAFSFLMNDHGLINLPNTQTNPIIGDKAYFHTYGAYPDKTVDEQVRVRTHLLYVLDLLRSADVSYLPQSLRDKRNENLDHLATYVEQGIFPANEAYLGQRKPCFIDQEGRICAVGYLVEQSASREIAEQINTDHQYETIMEMESELIETWVKESGLSKWECAMIQPTYYGEFERGTRSAAITSQVFTGINLGLGVLNGIQLKNHSRKRWTPILGMTTSSLQILYGTSLFTKRDRWDAFLFWYTREAADLLEKRRVMSFANIGIGSAMFLLSTSNLLFPRKKNRKYSYHFYSRPNYQINSEVGISFSRRF